MNVDFILNLNNAFRQVTTRRVIVLSAWALLGACVSDVSGLVKFTYPSVVDEVRFETTRTIVSVDGDLIRTKEGDLFRVLPSDADKMSGMKIWLPIFENKVGVEKTTIGDRFVLSYKRHTMICGTPFAALFTVPLVPVKVAKTYRVDVSVTKTKEPTNSSPPMRADGPHD